MTSSTALRGISSSSIRSRLSTRTPLEANAPIASSSWPGTPSLRTMKTSSGAPSLRATSYATGTPPRGKARTIRSGWPARVASRPASTRPASARSAKRPSMEGLLRENLRSPRTGSIEKMSGKSLHRLVLPFQRESMAGAGQHDQLRAGDGGGEHLRVARRDQPIRVAGQDQGRRADLRQAAVRGVADHRRDLREDVPRSRLLGAADPLERAGRVMRVPVSRDEQLAQAVRRAA